MARTKRSREVMASPLAATDDESTRDVAFALARAARTAAADGVDVLIAELERSRKRAEYFERMFGGLRGPVPAWIPRDEQREAFENDLLPDRAATRAAIARIAEALRASKVATEILRAEL